MEGSVRIRTVITVLAVAMVLMVAAPASAQEKGAANVSFGYSNLQQVTDPSTNIPAGWTAGVGVGMSANSAFVGEVGGHYKDGGRLHTFQGGLKFFNATNPKAVPFFQVLTGLGHYNGGGGSAWALTPGGGVDVQINEKASFRAQADWVFVRVSGVNVNHIRFGGSIVIKIPRG
jgi:hypothetical protein